MKWRHSKEAQAQKDKEKEQPDTSASESGNREPKEPLESECESDGGSECESDEAPEENSDGQLDVSELNKTSVIMSGGGPTSSAQTATTVTDTSASQILIWRCGLWTLTQRLLSVRAEERQLSETHPEWPSPTSQQLDRPQLIPGKKWSYNTVASLLFVLKKIILAPGQWCYDDNIMTQLIYGCDILIFFLIVLFQRLKHRIFKVYK